MPRTSFRMLDSIGHAFPMRHNWSRVRVTAEALPTSAGESPRERMKRSSLVEAAGKSALFRFILVLGSSRSIIWYSFVGPRGVFVRWSVEFRKSARPGATSTIKSGGRPSEAIGTCRSIPAGAPRYSSQAAWRDLHISVESGGGRPPESIAGNRSDRTMNDIVGTKSKMCNRAYLMVAFWKCVRVDSTPAW